MFKEPLISVITVSFNSVNEIEDTIKSVVNQSYSNIEYIIIDGGSKDGTVNIIKKFEDQIDYWVSEHDGGVYFGMNKGIQASHGDWLCFINSGDAFCNKDVLSNIFTCDSEYSGDGVIYGDVVLNYPPYGTVLKKHNNLHDEEQALGICHQSSFIKGQILREQMYDTSYKIFADIDFFYRIWKDDVKFKYVPIPIAVFEAIEGISSTKPWHSFLESNRVIDCHFYNSLNWWKRFFIISVKITLKMLLSKRQYRYRKFVRISNKYK